MNKGDLFEPGCRFNREILNTGDLCQVTRLPIILTGETRSIAGNDPTFLNYFVNFISIWNFNPSRSSYFGLPDQMRIENGLKAS